MSNFRRRIIMAALNGNGIVLPSSYKKVSYVTKTVAYQNAYINTGVIPTVNTKLLAISRDETTQDRVNWQGCVASNSAGWFCVGNYGTGTLMSICASISRDGAVNVPFDNDWHEYYISKGLQKIDNNVSELNSFAGLTTQIAFDKQKLYIYLFGSRAGWGDITNGDYGKVSNKEVIIWEGDEKIRHYVPCVRISDNKPGMYDIVNNTFNTCDGLTAYEITGEVSEIPAGCVRCEYLESYLDANNGNGQYIDTDRVVSNTDIIELMFALQPGNNGKTIFG